MTSSRPTCSGSGWIISGTTFTCSGTVSLSGDNTFNLASGVVVNANLPGSGGALTISGPGTINGNVTSNGGNGLRIQNGAIVNGNATGSGVSVVITGSTVAGAISSSGSNGITITNSTIPSGSINATNSTKVTISGSAVGSESSPVNINATNEVEINSSTTVYGNVSTTQGTVKVSNNSIVYGVCKNSSTNSTSNPGAFGNRCVGAPPPPAPAAFNAFETDTDANATAGVIKTKVAGTGFTLAIVAISGGTKMTSFTGQVKAELIANNGTPGTGYVTSTGCPVSGTVLAGSATTTSNFTAGRTNAATFAAVANAYRDVRVRISYPATGTATVVVCSSDSFAIRPAVLTNISVQDTDWESAGTTRPLDGTTPAATTIHKAGRPFRMALTARNAASAVTNGYSSSGLEVHSLVPIAPASEPGTLEVGTLSGAGTVISTSATYSDVGAFTATLRDVGFASIDSADTPGDCTATGRWVCSDSFSAGRFVPDVLEVSAVSLTPTCAAPGKKAFTYMGAPMQLQFTLTARNASGGVTKNYEGAFEKLDLTDADLWLKSASDSGQMVALGAANVPSGNAFRLGYGRLSVTGLSGMWEEGRALVKAAVTYDRPQDTTESPYENFRLGIYPRDRDDVTVAVTALNLDAEPEGQPGIPSPPDRVLLEETAMRLGRLRLSNAFGSEKLQLAMPVEVHYWTGNSWMLNSDDSNCTSLLASNFYLSNALTSITGGVSLVEGKGALMLNAPGAGVTGSVDIAANLGTSGSDQSCLANHGGSPASLPWLRSRNGNCAATYDRDPSARATFGIYSADRRRLIHVRELF